MDTLISNVTIVTMNEKMDVLFGAFLAIKDGKIVRIAKGIEGGQQVIDARGLTVTPGFIDSHSHSDKYMTLHLLLGLRLS